MRLDVLQRVLDHVMLGNQVLQSPAVGVLLNALCDDAETVEVDLLILCVLKVVPSTTTHTEIKCPAPGIEPRHGHPSQY